jgi:hypothetical protein
MPITGLHNLSIDGPQGCVIIRLGMHISASILTPGNFSVSFLTYENKILANIKILLKHFVTHLNCFEDPIFGHSPGVKNH